MINCKDNHSNMIILNMFLVIEDMLQDMDKEQKDAVIMLILQESLLDQE